MYDDLVKRLRSEAVYLPEKFSKNAELLDVLMKAADAVEELQLYVDLYKDLTEKGEKVARKVIDSYPKWIPVTERLPKDEETVLTWGKQGVILLDWRHDNKWCCFGNATHWMPLPKPPKEERAC